jgi:hypothetical protein
MSELDDLKRQVAELKDQLNPPPRQPSTHPRFDPTEGMSMPESAMLEMMKAVPDSLMRSLREDARRPNPVNPSTASQPTSQVQRGSGWAKPIPIESPPGIDLMDRMMDQQDRIDRAELAFRLAKAGSVKGDTR